MYARNLNVTVEPTTPATPEADPQRVSREQNGFKDTKFVGGLRNLFKIPQSVRSLAAYAKKWRRPLTVLLPKVEAAKPRQVTVKIEK